MKRKKRIAISVGDLNGIGIALALQNHAYISQMVEPLYCIDHLMLTQASQKLGCEIPKDFQILPTPLAPSFQIEAGAISAQSGAYAYASFQKAVQLAKEQKVEGIMTLPIHKKAWEKAGVNYKGHTDALRDFFQAPAIMMLGSPKMYVALFSEHIPLKEVASTITKEGLLRFFYDFYHTAKPQKCVGVLGLNPHAGDGGVLGEEEKIISEAIDEINSLLSKEENQEACYFSQPLVPDVAFTPNMRQHFTHYIAMYHDQGLAPLKALYFDEGINVSLNLPILRTSVDHGTAFDIAYKGIPLNSLSYTNAIAYLANTSSNNP